jgi:hypothetical protein
MQNVLFWISKNHNAKSLHVTHRFYCHTFKSTGKFNQTIHEKGSKNLLLNHKFFPHNDTKNPGRLTPHQPDNYIRHRLYGALSITGSSKRRQQ